MSQHVDVAIVGAGAAGVMTALKAAANPDLTVAVFEKDLREGANAAISSGSLAAGGTRFQRAAGIEDSPEQHAADILEHSHDEAHADLVLAVCRVAPVMVEWLADELAYPIEIGLNLPRAGMAAIRLHSDVGRQGGARLMRHLRDALVEHDNVALVDGARVVDLIGADQVTGVVIEQNGVREEVHADTVVLAGDGFANNRDLFARFCSDLGEPVYAGVSTSTEDAVPWLEERGAAFANMGACLRHGLVVADHGTRVSPSLQFYGAVWINTDGERFADEEAIGYSPLAGVLFDQPGKRALMVWDDEAMAITQESELMRESIAAGAFGRAGDVAELAERSRIPADRLEAALVAAPGRRQLRAPYHWAWVTHGVLTTQGGCEIDTLGRVLRADGTPIPGLRAAGGTAVGISGPHSDGYMSGNGLLAAFGMGWIIGDDLAAAGVRPD